MTVIFLNKVLNCKIANIKNFIKHVKIDYEVLNKEISTDKSGASGLVVAEREIEPHTSREMLLLSFSAQEAGSFDYYLKLIFQNEDELHVPIRMKVRRSGLNFDNYFYDFGIITERQVCFVQRCLPLTLNILQIGHELVIYGSNSSPRPSKIKEVIPIINEKNSIDIIVNLLNLLLPPFAENVPICTVEVKPKSYDSVRSISFPLAIHKLFQNIASIIQWKTFFFHCRARLLDSLLRG